MPPEIDREPAPVPRQLQPIFIVGQYKCGTSWLLRILSAHPNVIGVAEFDVLRAACDIKHGAPVLAPTAERLSRFFDKSSWCNRYTPNGWEYTDVVERFQRGEAIPTRPWPRTEPRSFAHLPAPAARLLYDEVAAATSPRKAMDAFLRAVSSDAAEETHVVFKSADQISRLHLLEKWKPGSKKIVIMRDGRDASISALHYRELMRDAKPTRGEPREIGYWELLQMWADFADMTLAAAGRGQIYLVRYEDLTSDFAGTLASLLQSLGLTSSSSLIETIQAKTSFEAMTGRARGTEAKSIMRKGAIGEWRETLSAEDQARAWRLAGDQLQAFGYTREGAPAPLPDLTRVQEQPYRLQRTLRLEQEIATVRAKLRETKAKLNAHKSARQNGWRRRIKSVVHAARDMSKHFARFFLSLITLGLPALDDALSVSDWIDSVIA